MQSYSFFTAPGATEAATFPAALNDDGQSVGFFYAWPRGGGFTFVGFLREQCSSTGSEDLQEGCVYKTISVPGSPFTRALGVNTSGTVAGWYDGGTTQYGFIMTRDGVFKSVSYPRANFAVVQGISDRGAICGYTFPASGLQVAFVAYPE